MASETEMEAKFWSALKSDRTFMLALPDLDEGHSRPMTAVLEHETHGPFYIFTAKDTELVEHLAGAAHDAVGHFAAKGHELFATVHGRVTPFHDRDVIERLWNPFIAAWYEGKDDPKLQLLRFDADHAEIWLNENSLFAGVKLLFGRDPKKDYQDKVAEVDLR